MEKLICRICKGHGKPSKGIVNTHDLRTDDNSKEFETKLVECLKCESCGHSWIPDLDINTWNFINMTKLNGKTYKMLRKPRTQTYAVVIEDETCKDIHMRDSFKAAETLYNTLINTK